MNGSASTESVLPDASLNSKNVHEDSDSELSSLGQLSPSPLTPGSITNGRVRDTSEEVQSIASTPKPTTNGHADDHDDEKENDIEKHGAPSSDAHHDHDDAPPPKRRRTNGTTPPAPSTPSKSSRKPKFESPPWKRFEADGPTTYTENGRRKSGRTNRLPLDLQPQSAQRTPRGAISSTQPTCTPRSTRVTNKSQKSASTTKASKTKSIPISTPKTASKKPNAESKSSWRTTRRPPSPRPTGSRHSTRRRSRRYGDDAEVALAANKERPGRPGVIPLVHPDQVRKRPKIGSSFEDFWLRGPGIPVEDGGLLASEDGPPISDEQALQDARLIIRIEDEAEPGGLLSQGRCSIFAPEGSEEPARHWARQDHMLKAMTGFRKLMLAEQQRHRIAAKKIAEACVERWTELQPKSTEEIEAEQRRYWISRYRLVARALFGTWENVRAEVNRVRLEKWQEEEQRRVKAALNEAVNLSEQKLQARQAGLDSEMVSEEEDGFSDLSDELDMEDDEDSDIGSENGSDLDADNEDSDNMSESDDEEGDENEDGGDERLTQEQLRAKYANIPGVDTKPDANKASDTIGRMDKHAAVDSPVNDVLAEDTSDESVDMDDDMGSTDMDDDDEDEDDDGEDGSSEDDEGDEAEGLLGLFFGKSELKKIQDQAQAGDTTTDFQDSVMLGIESHGTPSHHDADDTRNLDEDIDMDMDDDDDDVVSLVKVPDTLDCTPAPDVVPMMIRDASESANAMTYHNKTTPSLPPVEPPSAILPSVPDITAATSPSKNDEDDNPQVSSADEPMVCDGSLDDSLQDLPLAADSPNINESQIDQTETKSIVDEEPTENKTAEDSLSEDKSLLPTRCERRTEIPFLLRGTLREYQHDGLDWLAGLYANNTNGILADEMGLGKTIQTISLLAHLACHHGVWGPHLVIVPTSVMLNWEMEFKKWCPGFKILAYYGSQEERKRKRQGWNNDDIWNVCITSYQLVLQDQQVFRRRRWHYMILDEAHNIKNFKSQRWQTLLGFNTHSRLLLTGTPLQNNLTELWSLLFFLMPSENGVGGFADLREFQEWFHKPEAQILESQRGQMDDEAKAIISKLHKVLRPYLLRRLKADVEKQMPGKYEHVEFCRLSKRQRELYDGYMSRADTKEKFAGTNNKTIFNCLMELRKVCNHPDLFVDRPIMTSLRMPKSIAAEYSHTERMVQRFLVKDVMETVNLDFLNLLPVRHEHISTMTAGSITHLGSNRIMTDLRETQKVRAQKAYTSLDPSTVESNITYLTRAAHWGRFEELQHCVYLNALRRQQKPIYGSNLVELLTIGIDKKPAKAKPKVPKQMMTWFTEQSNLLRVMVPTLGQRAESLKTTIEKFSCVTPAVVTRDLEQFLLGKKGLEAFTETDLQLSKPVRWTPWMPKEPPVDPWHEARMRLSIQFPDKRLLQYDCGKLQVLDKLLRKLQAGGHRTLIFTQMVKVLDVLERFLNIHGHKYLRLDGATKVEQRQILTDRFNNDTRILCFILSTRSGGLGINLTGADTVIFYDQDWNPAMDKQCQDRVHRIGQTRDVHIYRLISEHTIEVNILRKASQKQMLDDVVIQEGDFTTDTFRKQSIRDVLAQKGDYTSEAVCAADAAIDRVLGVGSDSNPHAVGRMLEEAEDREDVTAARAAEKEIMADDADFTEARSGASTNRQGTPSGIRSVLDGGVLDETATDLGVESEEERENNAWGEKMRTVDEYMLGLMYEHLKDTKLELPVDKKRGKRKGKSMRNR